MYLYLTFSLLYYYLTTKNRVICHCAVLQFTCACKLKFCINYVVCRSCLIAEWEGIQYCITVVNPSKLFYFSHNEPVNKKWKADANAKLEEIHGTKVMAISSGLVPCNKQMCDLVQQVKPHVRQLVEDSNVVSYCKICKFVENISDVSIYFITILNFMYHGGVLIYFYLLYLFIFSWVNNHYFLNSF